VATQRRGGYTARPRRGTIRRGWLASDHGRP